MPQSSGSNDGRPPSIEVAVRGEMLAWLEASGGSLAVTTYNSGKLALFSAPGGKLVTRVWRFARPMGMSFAGDRFALAVREHIVSFRRSPQLPSEEQLGEAGPWPGGVQSANYVVDELYRTGRLDAHDCALAGDRLYFANTRYNCLARPSDRVAFLRSWQPPFISRMIPKDCCHLNGLGVRGGRIAMATAFGEIDRPRGWRELDRFSSGVVIDVPAGEVVVRGLNMPHSPRWHNQRWWVCESGAGVLATFDPQRGTREEVAALPGFTRGLAMVGKHALVGTSRIRPQHILDWPPLRQQNAKVEPGIWLVEAATGRRRGALIFQRGGSEVYEVAFLPKIQAAAFCYDPIGAQARTPEVA